MSETAEQRGWCGEGEEGQWLLVAGAARCAVTSRRATSVAARRAAIRRGRAAAIGGTGGVGAADALPRHRGCELLLDGLREGGTDG